MNLFEKKKIFVYQLPNPVSITKIDPGLKKLNRIIKFSSNFII